MNHTRKVTYKKPTQNAINLGYSKIKVVHWSSEKTEYKEYYYTNESESVEHLYRTQWVRHKGKI